MRVCSVLKVVQIQVLIGLIELLAVMSKICRKSEDQGEVETKYTPLRRLSCAAESPMLHFSLEVLSVQPFYSNP